MKKRIAVMAAVLIGLILSTSAEMVTAVQWGVATNIVSANQNFGRPDKTFSTGSYWTDPAGPAYYPNATGRSPSFYAATGMDLATGDNVRIDGGHVTDGGDGNDYIRYFVNDTDITEMRSMTMWKSADFMATGELAKMTHTGSVTFGAKGADKDNDLHFLIQTADSRYYVSQDVDFGGSLDISNATWSVFNPIVNYAASIGGSAGTIDVSADNIIGVGFYGVSYAGPNGDDAGTNLMSHETEGFLVEVIPEPSTIGLLSCAALITLFIRRIRM